MTLTVLDGGMRCTECSLFSVLQSVCLWREWECRHYRCRCRCFRRD